MNTIMRMHYIAAAYLAVALLARLLVFRSPYRATHEWMRELSLMWPITLPIALWEVVSDFWRAWRWERRLARKARAISALIDAEVEGN